MDANNPNKNHRTTPQYALYQRENFWASNEGKVPPFNTGKVYAHSVNVNVKVGQTDGFTDPGKLEELAKAKLTQNGSYLLDLRIGRSGQLTTARA